MSDDLIVVTCTPEEAVFINNVIATIKAQNVATAETASNIMEKIKNAIEINKPS